MLFKEEWEDEDNVEDLPDLQRMAVQCNKAMNSIIHDLKFTAETVLDYKENGSPL